MGTEAFEGMVKGGFAARHGWNPARNGLLAQSWAASRVVFRPSLV